MLYTFAGVQEPIPEAPYLRFFAANHLARDRYDNLALAPFNQFTRGSSSRIFAGVSYDEFEKREMYELILGQNMWSKSQFENFLA